MKVLFLAFILLLQGCKDTDQSSASFEITKKISSKTPRELFKDNYLPVLLGQESCPTDISRWYSNNENNADVLIESLPIQGKRILPLIGMLGPENKTGLDLDRSFNDFLSSPTEGNSESNAESKKTTAKLCTDFVKKILGLKTETFLNQMLKDNIMQLDQAAQEAKKNMELGSRFEVAINQSLVNVVKDSCRGVNHLKSSLYENLKGLARRCYLKVNRESQFSENAKNKFICDHFSVEICDVIKKDF